MVYTGCQKEQCNGAIPEVAVPGDRRLGRAELKEATAAEADPGRDARCDALRDHARRGQVRLQRVLGTAVDIGGTGSSSAGIREAGPVSMAQALAYQAAESNPERAPITGTVSGAKPAFGGNTEFTLIREGGEEELWEVRNNRLPRGPDIKVLGRLQPGLRLMGSALNGKAVRIYPSSKPGKASWVDLAEQEPQPKTAAVGAPSTAEERLAEVTRLHDAGVLTDEEYQTKRAEIIGEL